MTFTKFIYKANLSSFVHQCTELPQSFYVKKEINVFKFNTKIKNVIQEVKIINFTEQMKVNYKASKNFQNLT